jgi:hypothetical protein
MKVKALRVFNDAAGKTIRVTGEIFEVTKIRYEDILAADTENPLVVPLEDKQLEEKK